MEVEVRKDDRSGLDLGIIDRLEGGPVVTCSSRDIRIASSFYLSAALLQLNSTYLSFLHFKSTYLSLMCVWHHISGAT